MLSLFPPVPLPPALLPPFANLLFPPAQAQGGGDYDSGSLVLSVGAEVEGLDESFGGESLTIFSQEINPDITGGGAADDQIAELRYRDREVNVLASARLRGRTAYDGPLRAYFDVDAKAGDDRFSFSADATATAREGRLAGLHLRNLVMFDREQDGSHSVQDLCYLRLRRPLGASPWHVAVRGALDFSRAKGASADGDTLLTDWYDYLDYEKGGLRLELGRTGLSNTSLSAGVARKWTHSSGLGDYAEYRLSAQQGWFWDRGMLDGELTYERRAYRDEDSSIPSFHELGLFLYWFGQSAPSGWRCRLTATAIDYDERGGDLEEELGEDLIGIFGDDNVDVDIELLWRTYLLGGSILGGSLTDGSLTSARQKLLSTVEVSVGPTAELNRYEEGDGDGAAVGGRLEAALRGGSGRGDWWLEAGCEVGWHDYRADGAASELSFDGLTLSLSQTDFTYLEASLICGAALPWALEAEGYFSLDQEWHTASEDNARLLSFSLALRHRFRLAGLD